MPRVRMPMEPRPSPSMRPATTESGDLEDESTFHRQEFNLDLSDRAAESVEFEQCRFKGTDLARTSLDRAAFSDCTFESSNLANLHARRSSMLRVRLDAVRMTGLSWVDGVLRDVTVSGCRADLSSFRFTGFHHVVFDRCNLTRADFQNADLTGAWFTNCDLTRAQFSQAKLAGTRFTGCTLLEIGGVTSFDGAIVASHDLVGLSYTLAAALGIRLETAGIETTGGDGQRSLGGTRSG
jgi:uncharacterized protein YjbI with pentapeptide repeats